MSLKRIEAALSDRKERFDRLTEGLPRPDERLGGSPSSPRGPAADGGVLSHTPANVTRSPKCARRVRRIRAGMPGFRSL